ncbi:hypothetical protein VSO92_11755 [Myroides pelagicus]|uniref:hypothetical protein n=1 Tax=Myroides pelagicus TaxID=270914 RepID=UPI002DBA3822|nr:hypothetical protein [Myroides pelagicus]MEC4114775.1 hypothetical protein [Myroides pelagicus]
MARKQKDDVKLKNRLKDIIKEEKVSAILVGLWADVNKATVSAWNSNTSQPNDINLNKVGELFEIDNRMLLQADNRVKTGLAQALQEELNRLTKIEGIPTYINSIDNVSGNNVKMNNPILVKALKDFAENYKLNSK